jgi:hypothetical protein
MHTHRIPFLFGLAFLGFGCGAGAADRMQAAPARVMEFADGGKAGKTPEAWAINGNIGLTVESVDETLEALKASVKQRGGVITRIDRRGRGTWEDVDLTLRLPPDAVSPTLVWLREQGTVNHEQIQREEVGRRLFERKIALKTAEATFARLEALLQKPDIGVEEILAIEKEMGRLRKEIETHKGEQRYLKDRVAQATLTVRLTHRPRRNTVPNAKLYLSGHGSVLLRGDGQTLGYGLSLHSPENTAEFHLDADFFPAPGDDPLRFVLTVGGSSYSDFFGQGERSYLNPYLGFRMGYANFDAHHFVFGAETGMELFKHRYVLIDARIQGLGIVGRDGLEWVGLAGLGLGVVY